jgi:hypothetical protein
MYKKRMTVRGANTNVRFVSKRRPMALGLDDLPHTIGDGCDFFLKGPRPPNVLLYLERKLNHR